MMAGQAKESPIDDHARNILNELKPQIESKLGKQFSTFNPISYQTQVVSGTLHKFRIEVDGGRVVVASINESLPTEGSAKSLKSASFE